MGFVSMNVSKAELHTLGDLQARTLRTRAGTFLCANTVKRLAKAKIKLRMTPAMAPEDGQGEVRKKMRSISYRGA